VERALTRLRIPIHWRSADDGLQKSYGSGLAADRKKIKEKIICRREAARSDLERFAIAKTTLEVTLKVTPPN